MTAMLTPPTPEEYAPFYAGYIQRMQDKNVLEVLPQQIDDIRNAMGKLSDQQALFRDAPKEWSIKEVVGHVSDAERVFAYRALRFARNDQTPLASFDEQIYTPAGKFDARSLRDLAAELDAVRGATLALFRGLDGESLVRRGTASGNEVSVRALAYIIAGHERHHVGILRERYL